MRRRTRSPGSGLMTQATAWGGATCLRARLGYVGEGVACRANASDLKPRGWAAREAGCLWRPAWRWEQHFAIPTSGTGALGLVGRPGCLTGRCVRPGVGGSPCVGTRLSDSGARARADPGARRRADLGPRTRADRPAPAWSRSKCVAGRRAPGGGSDTRARRLPSGPGPRPPSWTPGAFPAWAWTMMTGRLRASGGPTESHRGPSAAATGTTAAPGTGRPVRASRHCCRGRGTARCTSRTRANANRGSQVRVEVRSAEGTKTVVVDQRKTPVIGERFHSRGHYKFTANRPAVVVVSNEGADGYVVIDAVQWLPR